MNEEQNEQKQHKTRGRFVQKVCAFSPEQLAEIESYAEARRKLDPGARFDVTDAVRVLCRLGLLYELNKPKGGPR